MRTSLPTLAACLLSSVSCRSQEPAPAPAPAPVRRPVPADLQAAAQEQEGFLEECLNGREEAHRNRSGHRLAELWRRGLLKDAVMERLVNERYQLVLSQVPGNYGAPSFEVRNRQTFPFPDVWTRFTPTLYVNGKVAWDPGRPQTERSMAVTDQVITSQTGGVIKNGDVIQYRITLGQDLEPSRRWSMEVWTNKVVLKGLKQ